MNRLHYSKLRSAQGESNIKFSTFLQIRKSVGPIRLMLIILNTIKNGKFYFWLRKINHQIHCYNYLHCNLHIICFCICLQSYLTTFYSLFLISGTFTIHMIIAALRAQTLFTVIVVSMATILDILFLVICRATYMKGWNYNHDQLIQVYCDCAGMRSWPLTG